MAKDPNKVSAEMMEKQKQVMEEFNDFLVNMKEQRIDAKFQRKETRRDQVAGAVGLAGAGVIGGATDNNKAVMLMYGLVTFLVKNARDSKKEKRKERFEEAKKVRESRRTLGLDEKEKQQRMKRARSLILKEKNNENMSKQKKGSGEKGMMKKMISVMKGGFMMSALSNIGSTLLSGPIMASAMAAALPAAIAGVLSSGIWGGGKIAGTEGFNKAIGKGTGALRGLGGGLGEFFKNLSDQYNSDAEKARRKKDDKVSQRLQQSSNQLAVNEAMRGRGSAIIPGGGSGGGGAVVNETQQMVVAGGMATRNNDSSFRNAADRITGFSVPIA